MKKKVHLLMTAITLTTVLLVTLASCGQIADVPQGYAKIRVGTPNGRAITADEKQNARFEFYFNDSRSDSNETVAQVGTSLRIKVVAIDARNGKQVATGEKTIIVAPGMNNVNIVLKEDRGADVNKNMVRWSAGVATVGQVENIPADESRSPGEVITVPQDPTWVHADAFNGWSYGNVQLVDENDSTISGNLTAGKQFKVPDGGVTLTAEWTPTQYIINYTASGGSMIDEFNATQSDIQLNDGESFSNGGNVLTKWQANGTDFASPNEIVPVQRLLDLLAGGQSIELTAKWEALQTFDVTFAPGDQASAQSMPQNTTTYNGGIISLAQKPTAAGYEFKGWKVTRTDNSTNITTLGENESQYTMPGEYEITLTAQWQIINYKIVYDGNNNTGGTVPTEAIYTVTNQTVTLATNTGNLEKTGYTFLGWNTADDASSALPSITFSELQTQATQDKNYTLTLYAVWEQSNYIISFNWNTDKAGGNDGSVTGNLPDNIEVLPSSGTATIPFPTVSRPGYTFLGWSENQTNSSAQYTSTYNQMGGISSSKTLYAVWEEKTGIYVVDSNGTETKQTDFDTAWKAAAGKTIKLYSDETLAGYKVVGSGSDYTSGSIVMIMSNGDITLDLNGHTLSYSDENTVIGVSSGGNGGTATFTLKDSSSAQSGKIHVGSGKKGVFIQGGTFIMESGLITGMNLQDEDNANNASGGAVLVSTNSSDNAKGYFYMRGGSISGNTRTTNLTSANSAGGAGVAVDPDCSFEMSGNASISNNTLILQNGLSGYGAGVYVEGEFTMSGNAEITGNIVKIKEGATSAGVECLGGGVYVYTNGTFTVSGGTISGNTADEGGGVYVAMDATFNNNGGTISGNTQTMGSDISQTIR